MLLDDAGPTERPKRRSAINDYLRDTLELFPDAMSERRDLGDVAHTFSHIAMTLDVEMMSVKARVTAFRINVDGPPNTEGVSHPSALSPWS